MDDLIPKEPECHPDAWRLFRELNLVGTQYRRINEVLLRMQSRIDVLIDERGKECQCDPPQSAEEYCTGHCVLRHERDELRAENARLLERIEQLCAAASPVIEIADHYLPVDGSCERLELLLERLQELVETDK